jgi:hypothetical protein
MSIAVGVVGEVGILEKMYQRDSMNGEEQTDGYGCDKCDCSYI